jgi:hypothetical protein
VDYLNKTDKSSSFQQTPEKSSDESTGMNRREVLARLGKGIVYTAPATLALLSLEAKATSVI